jgi:hypothetical protein
MESQIKIFYYDPCTNLYTGSALIDEEEKQRLTQSYTMTPVIPEKPGKLIIYNKAQNNWDYISKTCYQVDKNGFLLNKYNNPLPLGALGDDLIDEPPAESFQKPRWNGSSWEDKPVPENLFSPVFDAANSEWREGATRELIRNRIDAETAVLIAQWCVEQTKCEEYYLARGIEDNTDPEYLAYKDSKQQIIGAQRQRKIQAGVYGNM